MGARAGSACDIAGGTNPGVAAGWAAGGESYDARHRVRLRGDCAPDEKTTLDNPGHGL